MTALGTFEQQHILAELIAQFFDMKSGAHTEDCYEPESASPSSTGTERTLYEKGSAAAYDNEPLNRQSLKRP
jgi:hypothetical protein